ncbi:MAG: extracellular solute-binding protein [Rhodobiaceae bacterium]|nr:extracellular solute-binding protein [Rhodobiaceae bacterium]MCC0053177.1 extracellular solute-binding protein [Rhodobiaceae bacterium]
MISRLILSTALAGLLLVPAARAADPDLVVFDWSGYEDPEFYKSYTEKYGQPPQFSFFGDEEEAFQKLRAGFKADLAHPCSQSVVKWHEAGLLEPFDTARIPAWNDIMPGFKAMQGFVVDGKPYVIPLDWGATALTYRTDVVSAEDASSLQIFADPKYQGRISIGDNVDDAYALAFLATGARDWTKATEAQLDAASAFLRKVHPNVLTYWQDGASLAQSMTSGEVVLAWAWNETSTTLKGEGVPIAMNRDAKEGSSTWVCGYVNLVGGEASDDRTYDFVNAWLEDRTAEYIVTAWGYGHSNGAAMKKIDAQALADSGFDNLDAYTDKTLWQAPLPANLREKMIAEFEKIKAGF